MDLDFEQYKIAVDTAEKTTDRRNQTNTLYMAVLSLIVTGLLFVYDKLSGFNGFLISSLLSILGIGLSYKWETHIEYYKKLIKIKFMAVTQMEKEFELQSLYAKENVCRGWIGEGKNHSSEREKNIPGFFMLFFVSTLVLNIITQAYASLNIDNNNFAIVVKWLSLAVMIGVIVVIGIVYYRKQSITIKKKQLKEDEEDELLKEELKFIKTKPKNL